jgi:hypothetical protein
MTLFEYLSVAVSIVLGLGVTHILASLRVVLDKDLRHAAHAGWSFLLVIYLAQTWWGLWDLTAVESWNQFAFYYVLLGPGLLYSAATILIPDDLAGSQHWGDHFLLVRRRFLGVVLAFFVWALVLTWLLRGVSLLHPYRVLQATAILAVAVGASVDDRRYHAILPYALTAWILFMQAAFRVWPDALGT